MRHNHRARSQDEIQQKRSHRAEKSRIRQEMRQKQLIAAALAGDQKQISDLKKKIDAAERAAKMHRPEQSAERKIRLEKLRIERDVRAVEVAKKIRLPPQIDVFSRLFLSSPCGKRDGAALVAASPLVQFEMSKCDASQRPERALEVMRNAVILAGADRRCHPLHHGVVAGDETDDLVERALLLMVAAGGDLDRDVWAVIQHNGDGSEQGRHAHVAWIGKRDAGHSGAAVAARVWAAAAGEPGAAQGPSLGLGAAAGRDWANLELAGARIEKAINAGRLGIPPGAAAGGLFLYKGSWSAGDAVGGVSARGKPVTGALAHLFGRD